MNTKKKLLKVSLIGNSELKISSSIIFSTVLNLLSHFDISLFNIFTSLTKYLCLGTQQLVQRDISISEQLFGGLELTFILPYQNLEVNIVKFRCNNFGFNRWKNSSFSSPFQFSSFLNLFRKLSLTFSSYYSELKFLW